jgi:hypothetical protein
MFTRYQDAIRRGHPPSEQRAVENSKLTRLLGTASNWRRNSKNLDYRFKERPVFKCNPIGISYPVLAVIAAKCIP